MKLFRGTNEYFQAYSWRDAFIALWDKNLGAVDGKYFKEFMIEQCGINFYTRTTDYIEVVDEKVYLVALLSYS